MPADRDGRTTAGRQAGSAPLDRPGAAETPPGAPGRVVAPALLRSAFRRVPAAVAVLLAAGDDGGVHGLTCTAACSLSASPPMLLACLDERTGLADLVRAAGRFSLNYLAADRDHLARQFASSRSPDGVGGSDRPDRPGAVVVSGRTGVPVLATGTTAVFECTLDAVHRGGDHLVVFGMVRHARFQSDAEPLLYGAGRYGRFV